MKKQPEKIFREVFSYFGKDFYDKVRLRES